jgi:arginyl-tRNA synthetase
MDNNVSKNTFFPELFKLHLSRNNLAIKSLLKEQLVKAIARYQEGKGYIYNQDSLVKLIANKIILRNCSQKQPTQVAYRCAVAFPVAGLGELSPLTIAQELVQLLLATDEEVVTSTCLDFTVEVISPGWIDFNLGDRSLAVWLQTLVQYIQQDSQAKRDKKPIKSDIYRKNCFFLQYIHSRCCSLLRLAEQDGLIQLREGNFSQPNWQIRQPTSLPWLDIQDNLLFVKPSERRLLVLLLILVEELANFEFVEISKLTEPLGKRMLDFIAECRIWGEVKQTQPQLAQARLGLIALVQWYLQKLLQEQIGIDAPTTL